MFTKNKKPYHINYHNNQELVNKTTNFTGTFVPSLELIHWAYICQHGHSLFVLYRIYFP